MPKYELVERRKNLLKELKNTVSLLENTWALNEADETQVAFLMQKLSLPYTVGRILCSRGISAEAAEYFLNPKIQTLMPNPSVLNDMDKVSEFLANSIIRQEKIGIIGDYDVDGATSSAILRLYLESFGLEVHTHIPEREEGYGPSDLAFDEFSHLHIQTVCTTDCGTTAFEILERATQNGFNVIVMDHHEAETKLPNVFGVINPKRLDEKNDYPYLKYMSAVGVVFLTLVAVNRALKNKGFEKKHPLPDLMNFLDLVALGTVCDVVPLLGLNRAYVKQGLKVIAKRQNLGLTTLIDNSKITSRLSVYHLGYVLGPRINAGGRVGDSSCGHKLLTTHSPKEALELSLKLNEFNATRKDIEAHVLAEAIEKLEGTPQTYPMAFVYGNTWHQGVIGIVAGKLKERYHLPSFVMSIEEDEVKGSARSVAGLDLGALIMTAKEKGLLTKGGGHTMAAGFSLEEAKLEDFRKFAGEYIQNKLSADSLKPVLYYDAVLSLEGVNLDLAQKLELLEPFGTSNPEPKIVIKNIKISKPCIIGEGHVRCLLSSGYGTFLKAVCFKCADNPLGHALLENSDKRYDVLGTLQIDRFMNKETLQFIIDDMKGIENE